MDNRRNNEHYMDLTAYKAINNIERWGEKMELKKGAIFEYDGGYETRKVLIVSCDERKDDWYVNGIMLEAESKGTNLVPILCGEEMTADCDKISLLQRGKFGEYITTASFEEMEKVDDAILETFDLYLSEESERVKKLKSDLQALTVENEKLKQEKRMPLPTGADPATHIKLEAERDFYKQQYEMLLERLISK